MCAVVLAYRAGDRNSGGGILSQKHCFGNLKDDRDGSTGLTFILSYNQKNMGLIKLSQF